ncbi:hypothetical protein HID58_047067 [Brassica napus]|uniref:BnaCnng44020D protein n=2 Tax=Brassica napus TaxID=3708 RepID=A0A078JD12_BRANA|nr:hypothetical protein HID58_047067 [Brassica napus]CAF1906758.1 unnamed protein product [Brassica napus]CDY64506.1 BnaCnng44020D [Brassica napus]
MSKATVVLLLLVVAAVGNATAHKRKPRIIKHNGVVATDDERFDASVAAALCLGVVSPASSGLGGGASMVVKLADGDEIAYDSREVALRAAEVTKYAFLKYAFSFKQMKSIKK